MGPRQTAIEHKLQAALSPEHLDLENESHMHSGPARESHFNLVIVSAKFEGCRLVQRHRMVYAALGEELRGGLHALTMKALSPAEWAAAGGAVSNPSPPCGGGGKQG